MRSQPVGSGQSILASQIDSIRLDAQGAGSLLAHQQLGALALATLPTNGQVIPIIINGNTITITAVNTIGSTPNNVLIPGTAAGFVANLLNFLIRPDVTNANQVAANGTNQALLQYLGYALVGTTITIYSLNNVQNAPFVSLSFGSITVTSGSWTAQTMQVYVEPGVFYIGTTQMKFAGGSSPTVTGPVSNPRIDLLTISTSGTLAWTTGTENASPVPPSYPFGVVPICELYNIVSETALYDNANQQSGEGYISADVRPFNNVIYINNNAQIAAGVIQASNLANAGTIATGSVAMHAGRAAPAGYLICDGSAVSRTTYATLFSTIAPAVGTFTVTIASPAVFTLNSHGFVAGDRVYFTTTGSLPTGLTANTIYYVIASGLTTNAFEVSTTSGGSAVNTTGSQSGTHTCNFCPFGLGDGSTTFNVPSLKGNVAVGFLSGDANFGTLGQTGGAKTTTFTPNVTGSPVGGNNQVNNVSSGSSTPLVSVAGASTTISILPPYLTLNFIIKT